MPESTHPNGHTTSLQETSVFISRAFAAGENPENIRAAGDVLPRTCIQRMGVSACQECVYYEEYPDDAAEAKVCSERNLVDILREQDIAPQNTLLVSVTANGVGFYDSLQAEEVTENEFGGYEQVKGYNSFFARMSEREALGSRLADCGHVAVEFDLPDGDQAFGFIHMTRTNMQGTGAETFGEDEQKQHYVAYALSKAAEHYGVSVADMRIKLTAAIDKLVYTFKPSDDATAEQMMDKAFAGWFDMGLLHNLEKPDWQRGDPIEPSDVWHADYHAMCEHLLSTSGVRSENIDMAEIVNPGIIESGHASNVAGKHGKRPEARDLYLVRADANR